MQKIKNQLKWVDEFEKSAPGNFRKIDFAFSAARSDFGQKNKKNNLWY